MKSKFIKKRITYTGEQLHSKWAQNFRIKGDSIVAFIGPARVVEHMVDLEDIKKKAFIYSDLMLHFIVEHFGMKLPEAVARQRLLMALIAEHLNHHLSRLRIQRSGDDLYDGKKKLSVSIATLSPVSAMIHVGLNITTSGTPVPTIGLKDYKIRPQSFARGIMQAYLGEVTGITKATKKVRPVR